jgi:putative copper resistance protein D
MIEGAWLVLRAAGLVLTFQATGTALFSIAFARQLTASAPAIYQLGRRAALAALLILALQLLLEPAHMAGEWSGAADPAVLRMLRESPGAAALAVRGVGLAYVAMGAGRGAPLLLLPAVCAVLGSFTLSGHTLSHDHRAVLAALLLVHLAIVTFWFGALLPLRQILSRASCADAARVLAAFSAVALWLVPLIALAGATLAALLLPDLAALGRPYGRLLLAKLTLFAALMGLAALNRLRLTPGLAAGQVPAAVWLRRSIALEYLLICAALAISAVLTGSFSPD